MLKITKIKTIYKIIIICISIFILGLYIAKISIDSTFNEILCDQVVQPAIHDNLIKTVEV